MLEQEILLRLDHTPRNSLLSFKRKILLLNNFLSSLIWSILANTFCPHQSRTLPIMTRKKQSWLSCLDEKFQSWTSQWRNLHPIFVVKREKRNQRFYRNQAFKLLTNDKKSQKLRSGKILLKLLKRRSQFCLISKRLMDSFDLK